MTIAISANPGQTISLVVNINDGYFSGATDGYAPVMQSIFYPNGNAAPNFPAPMTLITAGIYKFNLILPSSVIGTFIAIAAYQPTNPTKNYITNEVFMINVAIPAGAGSFVAPG